METIQKKEIQWSNIAMFYAQAYLGACFSAFTINNILLSMSSYICSTYYSVNMNIIHVFFNYNLMISRSHNFKIKSCHILGMQLF